MLRFPSVALLVLCLCLAALGQTSSPNFCLDADASASASSQFSAGFPAESAIDGDRAGRLWGAGGGWADATRDAWPDVLEVDFGKDGRAVGVVRVFTLGDTFPSEPTASTTALNYGVEDYTVELLDGSGSVLASASVVGNTKAESSVTFPTAPRARRLRLRVDAARGHFSRVVEVEAGPHR